ncbi:hypothetical protein [Brachybacterium vulturis]|uniref:DUF7224 domain-containing protein n=1 Tax=Brachybacterium vulturis TaxID=2017484 RepID=UPI003736326C
MKVWAWVRLLGLWWLMPLEAGAMLIGRAGTFPMHPNYALARQYTNLEASILCFPLIALAATVAAHRIVRSGFLERVSAHRFLRGHLVPMLGIGVPSWCLALWFQATPALMSGSLEVAIAPLLVAAAWISASVGFGWLLGSHALLRIAAPLSVLTVYIGAGFPAALDPPWLRHLTGLTSGCCAIYEVADLQAAAAGILTVGAVLGMSLVFSAVSTRALPRVATACVALGAVIAVATGITLARPLPRDAVLDRPGPMSCVDVGRPLCVWPEHAQLVHEHRAGLLAMTEAVDGAGLELPTAITERKATEHPWPESTVSLSSERGKVGLYWAYAEALLPRDDLCLDRPDTVVEDYRTVLILRGAVMGWLVRESGGPLDENLLDEESLAVLERMSSSSDHGAATVREIHAALLSCEIPADLADV